MAIAKISGLANPLATKINSKKNINEINKNIYTNNILQAYPVSYYISFKGTEKSDELVAFEKCIDDFCEKNMGEELSKVDTYSFVNSIPKTESRFVNDKFRKNISDIFSGHSSETINTEFIIDAMKFSLDTLRNGFREPARSTVQKVCLEPNDVATVIEKLKKENKFPQGNLKTEEQDFRFEYLKQIMNKLIDPKKDLDEDIKSLLDSNFKDAYFDYKKQNLKPRVDEELQAKLKGILKDTFFVNFDKKMLAVHKQDKINKLNGTKTSTEVANELYEDSINNKINIFDNPKFYEHLSKNDAHIDFLLEKIYGYGVFPFLAWFDETGVNQKHKVLLADPGFANRIVDFNCFVKEKNINTDNVSPFELREMFSKHLGNDVVYRGLYAKNHDEMIDKLRNNDDYAIIYEDKEKVLNEINYYLTTSKDTEYEPTIKGKISSKVKGHSKNEFMSVSYHPEIASAVARGVAYNQFRNDEPTILIKTEIPKLSIIRQDGLLGNMQYNSEGKILHVGTKRFVYDKECGEIEAFVPFKLSTSNSTVETNNDKTIYYWGDY